jgi:hypothetical protein
MEAPHPPDGAFLLSQYVPSPVAVGVFPLQRGRVRVGAIEFGLKIIRLITFHKRLPYLHNFSIKSC